MDSSKFYNWDQTEKEPPLTQDDLQAENHEISIVARTQNYIVTKNNRVYDTQTVPFTLVYQNTNGIIYDIKEYQDFIIVLMQEDESMPAQPYVLVKGSDFLISLDGIGNGSYVSADVYETDLSLLTLSLIRLYHYWVFIIWP